MESLGSWEETFRNVALGQRLSGLGLPQAAGMGDGLSVFSSPNFYLRPEELQKNKYIKNQERPEINKLCSKKSSLSCTDEKKSTEHF